VARLAERQSHNLNFCHNHGTLDTCRGTMEQYMSHTCRINDTS